MYRLEIIVPYKRDFVERELNYKTFNKFYSSYINDQDKLTIVENYQHRYEVFNSVAATSQAKYIALTDIDAIVHWKQIEQALTMFDDFDVVYPFDKILNVEKNGEVRDEWPKGLDRGLMVIFDRQKFIDFGGENTQFKGYGWEDVERYYRALNAGYRIGRVDGVALHLQHPRVGFDNPHLSHNRKLMQKEKKKWDQRVK